MNLGGYTIERVDNICKKYYSDDKYRHAVRVMKCLNLDMIPFRLHEACKIIALMHDLLEDTDFDWNGVWPLDIYNAVNRITHKKEKEYYKYYIRRIREACSYDMDVDICVWWVKLADMKEHLSRKETLTDKLKEKYLEGLAELL